MYVLLNSQTDGTADDRITIQGAGNTDKEKIVLRGTDANNRIFEVKHEYYTIEVRIARSLLASLGNICCICSVDTSSNNVLRVHTNKRV